MEPTRENPAATKRHRWQLPEGEAWAEAWRTKTCRDCGLQAGRFGNGVTSYTVFSLGDQIQADTSRGDRTPPCQPERNVA